MNRYDLLCAQYRLNPSTPRHQIKCPCHADSTASLSISRGKTVDLVLHCHAGCLPLTIMETLALPLPESQHAPEPVAPPRIVAEYVYTDATGKPVAIKRRMDPKKFVWLSEDPTDGRMRQGLPDGGQTGVPLYRAAALAEANGGRMVFVVEGEKDADTLANASILATCNPEGASGAGSAYTEERWASLRSAHVCILPDNDEPGQKHAQRIADVLLPLAASVRIVNLPGLPEKGDVSDWMAQGGTVDALRSLVAATSPLTGVYVPPTPLAAPVLSSARPQPLKYGDFEREAHRMTEPISVVPTPFPSLNDVCRRGGARQGWRLGWHIVLAGAPGYGKTTVALNCAVHAACAGKRVGIVSLEMGQDEIMAIMLSIATRTHEKELEATPGVLNQTFLDRAKVFQQMLETSGGGVYLVDMPRSDLQTVERTVREMIAEGCELIVVDYMQRITVQGKSDDYGRLTDISNTLQGIAKQERVVTLALSQFNRGTSGASYAPKAQGLKGSSAIEDDANQILLIDHSRYFRRPAVADGDSAGADIVVSINKNRHGPLTDLSLFMNYNDLTVTERSV